VAESRRRGSRLYNGEMATEIERKWVSTDAPPPAGEALR
jgi:hypothetical protein